jgi:cell division protein FtsL
MNAAARAIHEGNIFSGHLADMRLSKEICFVFTIFLLVLVSAWLVVYTTNEHRSHFSQLQQLEQESHQLKLQWGQLLLEQASLARPARVEELAVDQLEMQLPNDKQTFVLQSR